jgi:hypothetical protein
MKRTIYPYHGSVPAELEKIFDRIAVALPLKKGEVRQWEYTGSLDDLSREIGDYVFMVYPSGVIFVTQHPSLGSR